MSKLPAIKTPTFTTTLDDGRVIRYSMFTKKDEKALLYIKENDDKNSRINAIADLVAERTMGDVNPKKDPKWLVEYIYLLLRRDSIEPIISFQIKADALGLKTENANGMLDAIIDLNELVITNQDNTFDGSVDISDFTDEKTVLKFNEPTIYDYLTDKKETEDLDVLWNCFDVAYVGKEILEKDSLKKEEFISWIETLTSEGFEKINEQFNNINRIEVSIKVDDKEILRLHDILNFLILS